MKKLIYSATIVSALLLAACTETAEENVGDPIEEVGTEETSAGVESENAEGNVEGTVEEGDTEETSADVENPDLNAPKVINQLIADDEIAKITLTEMTKVTDASGANVYEMIFEIENKSTNQLDLGHMNVSANEQKLTPGSGQTTLSRGLIDSGTTGRAKIQIIEKNELKLPELNSVMMDLMFVGLPTVYPVNVTF